MVYTWKKTPARGRVPALAGKEGPAVFIKNKHQIRTVFGLGIRNNWYLNDKRYKFFKHDSLLNLQKLMKFFFYLKKEKSIWAPNKLGGVMVKKELMNLFN